MPVERTGIEGILRDVIVLDQVLIFPAAVWLCLILEAIGCDIHLDRERSSSVGNV